MGAIMGDDPVNMAMRGGEDSMDLPPGFRFYPTDEEIVTHYLFPKVMDCRFTARAIGEVDLNKSEPWELPSKAKIGEKEFYFFCHRDRKYPTGMRTNRATEAGYWKATGKDKDIYKGKDDLVGMKKTLVFYKGRAPKGEKTNWVMHEYRLEGKDSYWKLPKSAKDDWVVCRIFHKTTGMKRGLASEALPTNQEDDSTMETQILQSVMESSHYLNNDGLDLSASDMALCQNYSIMNDQLISPYSMAPDPRLYYSQAPVPNQSFPDSSCLTQNRNSASDKPYGAIGDRVSLQPTMAMQCKTEQYPSQSQMVMAPPDTDDIVLRDDEMDLKNMWAYQIQ